MNFWGHLEALRTVLIKIVAVVGVLAVVSFAFMPWIFDHVILAPTRASFPLYNLLGFVKGDGTWIPDMASSDFHVDIINIQLASQFFVHISASLWLALAVAFPIVVYLLWSFVAPGLYENERRGARKAFIFGNILFYIGMFTGYSLVFPLCLRFLADYHLSDSIPNTVSLNSYIDTFYMLVLMMGVLFELPVVTWMLGKAGVLHRGFFNRYRRHAIVALLLLAAFITPTSDIFTLTMVFAPIYFLWECSALTVPKAPKDAS